MNPRSDERTGHEGAREASRRGAEQAERIARATADVNTQAARTSADMMERNVKTTHQVLQSGAGIAASLAERSAQHLNRMFGLTGEEAQRAAESSTGHLAALLQSGAGLAEFTQNMALEWMTFSRDRVEQNLDQFDHLLNSRTPHDVLALQSEMMKSNLEGLLGFTRRAAERSIEVAEELARKFNESAGQTRRAA
jgi:RNA 3'-terminal phosphate cyclase